MSDNEKRWFVLRTTYCRESQFMQFCKDRGIECFVPMHYALKKVRQNGKERQKRVIAPSIHNIVFVHESKEWIDEIVFSHQLDYLRYYYDKTSGAPMQVPDSQMKHFMAVANVQEEDTVFLPNLDITFKAGDKVRITKGTFEGIEGRVMRIKGQQRVIVSIPHLFAIATAYIPTAFMEKVEED
ncbi:MAG: UpxY family transcription antiterminator [Bacteroidaceae bacterium]|nr:UpxY family transcription antiterminator [Bacteroidaceae bacterium]